MEKENKTQVSMRAAGARTLQLTVAGDVELSSQKPAANMGPAVKGLFRKYTTTSFDTEAAKQIQVISLKRKKSHHDEQELFMELIYDIQHELDTEKLCFKILHNIAMLTNCDRSSLFLTKQDGDKFYLVCKIFDLTADSVYEDVKQEEDDTFIIPFGRGILGHVAESKTLVKIDNAYEDARFNRAIDDQTGYRTNSILCMPIMDSNENVVGVAQIINKCDTDSSDMAGHMFSDQDVLVFKKYLMFCGIGITNAQLFQLSMKEYQCNQLLLQLARSIFKDSTNVNTLIERIMMQSLQIVECQLCKIFLCEQGSKENVKSSHFSHEFTWCAGKVTSVQITNSVDEADNPYVKIAEHVQQSGKTFSARNFKELQEKAGQINLNIDTKNASIQNMMCTPVKNADDEIIGVAQMINKQSGVFSQADISAFEGFVIYCGLGIQNTRLYEDMNRMHNFQKVCLEMVSYHSTAQEDEVHRIQSQELSEKKKEDLLHSEFDNSTLSDDESILAVIYMYKKLGLIDFYKIDTHTMFHWACSVKKNYRAVEFHNWQHAFSVGQAMFWLISQSDVGEIFTELEKLVLLSSALCHDLDHRGTNNAYQQKSKSPLAALHNTSTMEHHHFDMCIMILNTKDNNILESLPPDDYLRVVSLLKHCILATDLALHFQVREKMNKLLKDSSGNIDWITVNNKMLIMSLLMTTSDLCASAKPWSVQKKSAGCISEEFYQQGDKEKDELHQTPAEMMDRQYQDKLPKLQMGFFDGVCLPVFKMLSPVFPSLKLLYEQCQENRANWQKLDEAAQYSSKMSNDKKDSKTENGNLEPANVETTLADFISSPIHRRLTPTPSQDIRSGIKGHKGQQGSQGSAQTTSCSCNIS